MAEDNTGIPVLVIDDERDIREGCQRVLSRIGCRVDQAADGRQGLEFIANNRYKVVLLDLKMPGMGGMEVLGELQGKDPDMLVIVITGYATVETAIEAMKLGAYDFIPKPFKPDELRLTVGRALERIRLQEEARRLEQERLRTLADLHTEQSRTRTIIQAVPFGVMVTSTDGRVALINPALRRLLDLEEDRQPGGPVSDYVADPGFVDMALRLSEGVLPPGPGRDWSHEFVTPSGNDILVLGTRILHEDRTCLGGVLVLMDMTPYKVLDRLKSEFVAKVSHELRSPLSTILLQLQVVNTDGGALGEDGRQILSRAQERTKGLISFVKDLLDLSRVEEGRALGTAREFAPEEALKKALEAVAPQAQAKGHKLALDLPEEPLPLLTADPAALDSILVNLLTNAVNYSPDPGPIILRAACREGLLRLEVEDRGIGIPPEKQAKIFEKFYRVKTSRTAQVVGTGLGLPIVKSLAGSMGGRVELESREGGGSLFRVLLPLGREEAGADPGHPLPRPSSA